MSEHRHDGAASAAPGSPRPQEAAAAYAAAAARRVAAVPGEPLPDGAGPGKVPINVSAVATVEAAEGGPGGAAAGEPDENGEQSIDRLLEELSARAEKADEYLELAQRTKADFENYRKRAQRNVAEAQERGVAKLAKELLPAIDNLDRAVQASETFAAGSPEETAVAVESQLVSGIRLVHADVLAALARVGIEAFSPAGEPFDPKFHEAVAQAPIEGAAAGTVTEVYQQGFRLGEMVLRPARVLVAA